MFLIDMETRKAGKFSSVFGNSEQSLSISHVPLTITRVLNKPTMLFGWSITRRQQFTNET